MKGKGVTYKEARNECKMAKMLILQVSNTKIIPLKLKVDFSRCVRLSEIRLAV